MNKNRLIVFAVIFGLMGILSYVLTKENKPVAKKSEFAVKKKEDISKIEIVKNGKTFEFEKENSKWIMNKPEKYLADAEVLDSILGKLEKMEFKDILTNSEKDYSKVNVDKTNGINVKIFTKSKETSEFTIGKMSSDYSSSYVRKGKNVYIIKDILSYYFSFDEDSIKDKKIIDFDSSNIQEFKLVRNGKTEQYTIKDNAWINSENKQVNPDDYFNVIRKTRLVKFKKEDEIKKDFGNSNSAVKVLLKYKDGKNDEINISKIKRENLSASSTYNNLYFELSQASVDAITSTAIKIVEQPKNTTQAAIKK